MNDASPYTFPRFLCGSRDQFHLSRRSAAMVALFGAGLLLIDLGGARALTYHEVLFAQPAKEMLATGDWIVPRIAGIPSTHKPPVTHWLIALSMALFQSDAEWVVRLPAVVATIVLGLTVAWLAARFFGDTVGLLAGLIQLTTMYSVRWGRLAECDIILCAAVTLAMTLFAVANVDGPAGRRSDRWIVWAFYATTAFATLTKGLAGPVFIFGGTVTYFLVTQNVRGLKWLLSPVGILILLVPVIGWYAAAIVQYPQMLHDQIMHHFGRFEGALGGQKSIFFYFYNIPMLLLPWTPFAVMAIIDGVRRGQHSVPLWRLVACWFFAGFAVLMLSRFKSNHYAAPLLPPISILAALGLRGFLRQRYLVERPRHGWFVVLSWIGCAIGAAVVLAARPKGAAGIVVLIAGIGLSVPIMLYFERRRQQGFHLAAMFATVWALCIGVQVLVMPYHNSYGAQTELAARTNGKLPPNTPLYMVQLPENQITYYLNSPIVRLDEVDKFEQRTSRANPQYVLAPEYVAKSFTRLGKIEVIDRCATINRYLTERERLTLVRLDRFPAPRTARGTTETHR